MTVILRALSDCPRIVGVSAVLFTGTISVGRDWGLGVGWVGRMWVSVRVCV